MDRELALMELDRMGVPLPDDLIRDIKSLEKDKAEYLNEIEHSEGGPMYDGRRHLWLYKTPEDEGDNPDVVNDPNYYDKIPKEWFEEWKDREITPKDWKPKGCPEDIPAELVEFVFSANPRFDQLMAYKPFWLYCEYARRANLEPTSIEDYRPGSSQWVEYGFNECDRCKDNHLYALDRYAWIKDEQAPNGRRDYKASTPQALLCYLKNIGVNYVLAKGRQAAITSTEMACAALRTRLIQSYKGIMVTDDKEETGKSIFGEKYMYTGSFFPNWLQPRTVLHDSSLKVMYGFGTDKSKGKRKKFTTEMSVFGSRDTQAVNGTSPTDLYIDEAQNVSTLQKLLQERRPTSWSMVGGKMRLVRQSFVWGTASSNNSGKGSFEDRYKQVKSLMKAGKPTGGWLAVFFDAFCRPGMSKEVYLREYYEEYMSEEVVGMKGLSIEDRRAMFASHYPMSDEDAFSTPANTVISSVSIKNHIDRIVKKYPQGPIRGEFVPVFDHSKPMPKGSHFPFYVKSVEFKKASPGDIFAPVFMFKDREENCSDNYYQGTDPIQSFTGLSRMASVIMAASAKVDLEDKGRKVHIPAPVCWVNHIRSNGKLKESFAQVKLMGMYYANRGERACPELVEVDQGHNYIEFCGSPEMLCEDSLVLRTQLGPSYQIGGHHKGVAMKEATKSRGHKDLLQMIDDMGHNIYSMDFWSQLKNITQEEGKNGSIKWGTADVRRFNDDLVIAMLLAYVCMTQVGAGMVPIRHGIDEPMYETQMVRKRVNGHDFEWVEERVEIEHLHE